MLQLWYSPYIHTSIDQESSTLVLPLPTSNPTGSTSELVLQSTSSSYNSYLMERFISHLQQHPNWCSGPVLTTCHFVPVNPCSINPLVSCCYYSLLRQLPSPLQELNPQAGQPAWVYCKPTGTPTQKKLRHSKARACKKLDRKETAEVTTLMSMWPYLEIILVISSKDEVIREEVNSIQLMSQEEKAMWWWGRDWGHGSARQRPDLEKGRNS